jgi:hypothetical protein
MRAQLARCLLRQGQASRGIAQLEEALTRLQAIGDDSNYVANVRLWLGRARLARGEIEDAEAQITQAVTYYRRTREEGHPARAEAECEFAEVLAAKGRRVVPRRLRTRPWPIVSRNPRHHYRDRGDQSSLMPSLDCATFAQERDCLDRCPHSSRSELREQAQPHRPFL